MALNTISICLDNNIGELHNTQSFIWVSYKGLDKIASIMFQDHHLFFNKRGKENQVSAFK